MEVNRYETQYISSGEQLKDIRGKSLLKHLHINVSEIQARTGPTLQRVYYDIRTNLLTSIGDQDEQYAGDAFLKVIISRLNAYTRQPISLEQMITENLITYDHN